MSFGKLLSVRLGLRTSSSRSLIKPMCAISTRAFTTNPSRYTTNKDAPTENGSSSSTGGTISRTDKTIQFSHPPEHSIPSPSIPPSNEFSPHNKPTLPSFSLLGRTVVITGGARGLGLVMAQACIISGADVALVDLNETEASSQASALLSAYKSSNPTTPTESLPKITSHYADVSDPISVDNCIAEILQSHSKIDSLVTSAGFTENFPAERYPIDRMRKLWAVNVDGTYLFATAVARHVMSRNADIAKRKQGEETVKGSMVLISSMSSTIVNVPQPQAPYNASKAAVRHLASSLAVEWAGAGIRVNCISPGYMLTQLTGKMLVENPALKKEWVRRIPMGRMGDPQELGGCVVWLLGEGSGYVTGGEVRVDGGYTCV